MARRKLDVGKAVAYIRVSTQEQDLGPEDQIFQIKKWCSKHGIELVGTPHLDKLSGGISADKRPALAAAMRSMRELRAGTLIAHKRDRFARDTEVSGALGLFVRNMGGRLCTTESPPDAGETPMQRAMQGVRDLMAEFERMMIKDRTKSALAVKRRNHERVGTIPFGYKLAKDGVHLVKDRKEQAVVREIKRLRAKGISLRKICAHLEEQGSRQRNGNPWHPYNIQRIAVAVPVGE